jgi:hypothetical protein
VIDGQIIFLLLNGISKVKYSMLTTKKESLAHILYSSEKGNNVSIEYLTQKHQ